MNPSPQDLKSTRDVLELASLLDHRIPTPDKARIMAWAQQIARHRLDRDDMLDAVHEFYDHPSAQPISIADVTEGARKIKRDRNDRNPDEVVRAIAPAPSEDAPAPGHAPHVKLDQWGYIDKTAPDEPDYPADWTSEQRLSAYWQAIDKKFHPEKPIHTHRTAQEPSK